MIDIFYVKRAFKFCGIAIFYKKIVYSLLYNKDCSKYTYYYFIFTSFIICFHLKYSNDFIPIRILI